MPVPEVSDRGLRPRSRDPTRGGPPQPRTNRASKNSCKGNTRATRGSYGLVGGYTLKSGVELLRAIKSNHGAIKILL